MRSEYFFDKRTWKRGFIKYGVIFLISFLPIVLFNIYVGPSLGREWLVILLDSVLLLACVAIGSHIANKIFAKNDEKLDKRRKEREYIRARSQEILDASYKSKRKAKEVKKQNANKSQEEIVIEVDDKKVLEVQEKTKSPKTNTNNKNQSTQKRNISIKRRK